MTCGHRVQRTGTVAHVRGYDEQSYGDAFADVYDDWYRSVSDVDLTVVELLDLTDAGPVLELGVGTGRLAVPLAEAGLARGVRVTGIDASQAMLDRLAWRDPGGLVEAVRGHMVDDLPPGPFGLVFVAYNTLFSLTDDGAQQRCFATVAERLRPGARFVVEAFVPEDPPRGGDTVNVRSLAADRVVLSVSVTDPDRQTAEGQFVELSESGGVRLRPWSVRYATTAQLDVMAAAAGLELEQRWEAFDRSPFHDESSRHVSVYIRRT
jgi:SAM-dependent methyltransferase